VTAIRYTATSISVIIIFTLSLIFPIITHTAIAQSGTASPPSDFDAASPTMGLWKGWPVGTTATFRRTLTDRLINMKSVQFYRLLLVGRSPDGSALVAGYRAEQQNGPWEFVQTASDNLGGFLHEAGIRLISEKKGERVVNNKSVECIVRSYAGTRDTRWAEHVEGVEWTIGPDGPAIYSSVVLSYELAGQKNGMSERVSCPGEESVKIGTHDFTAYQTVDERLMDGKVIGGNIHRLWSPDVPGWLVRTRIWNKQDEKQPPGHDDELIEFGPEAELLARYVKTDRPPEIVRTKMLSQFRPTTRPTSMPMR
jgi:hypothetical protein